MDVTTNYALRVFTLIAIGGGLPAWAILGKFPGPSHASAPSVAAKAPTDTPKVANQAPRARFTDIEPIPSNPTPAAAGRSSMAEGPPPAPLAPAEDRLTQVQERLKQLGAYYILLESMQSPSPSYRFHVALGSGASDSTGRRFEASDSQPMRAMERVLAEVEAWSAQRLSLRGGATDRR